MGYGNLYNIVSKQCCPRIKEVDIDREIPEWELRGYNTTRPKIFSPALEYEKAVVKKIPIREKNIQDIAIY